MKHFLNSARIEKYELLDGRAIIDRNLKIVTANEAMYQFMGISKKYDVVDVIHQVDLDDFINVANGLHSGEKKNIVLRMRRVDNSYRWMFVLMHKTEIITGENKRQAYLELKISDIIALNKEREHLLKQQDLFRTVFSAEGEFLFTYSHINDEFIIYRYIDNDAVNLITGTLAQVRERFLASTDEQESVDKFFQDIENGKINLKYHLTCGLFNDNQCEPLEIIASSHFQNGRKESTIGSIRNLNENISYSIQTYQHMLHDKLLTYDEVHAYAMNNIAANSDVVMNLILFQIDQYDEIAQKFGNEHAVLLYKDIFQYIQNDIGARGVVGKYNYSTFFIAIKNLENDVSLRAFLESLRSTITWKYGIVKNQYRLTFSIGIARYPYNGRNYDIITKKLLRALELANRKGHNRYIIYRENLHGDVE